MKEGGQYNAQPFLAFLCSENFRVSILRTRVILLKSLGWCEKWRGLNREAGRRRGKKKELGGGGNTWKELRQSWGIDISTR